MTFVDCGGLLTKQTRLSVACPTWREAYGDHPRQQWRLEDLLSDVRCDRDGSDLEARGLAVVLPRVHAEKTGVRP